MSYHILEIPKGEYGEFSKIKEEFTELNDAYIQDDTILQLVELADLVGAIEAYAEKHLNHSLEDIIRFMQKTKRAFQSGKRKQE